MPQPIVMVGFTALRSHHRELAQLVDSVDDRCKRLESTELRKDLRARNALRVTSERQRIHEVVRHVLDEYQRAMEDPSHYDCCAGLKNDSRRRQRLATRSRRTNSRTRMRQRMEDTGSVSASMLDGNEHVAGGNAPGREPNGREGSASAANGTPRSASIPDNARQGGAADIEYMVVAFEGGDGFCACITAAGPCGNVGSAVRSDEKATRLVRTPYSSLWDAEEEVGTVRVGFRTWPKDVDDLEEVMGDVADAGDGGKTEQDVAFTENVAGAESLLLGRLRPKGAATSAMTNSGGDTPPKGAPIRLRCDAPGREPNGRNRSALAASGALHSTSIPEAVELERRMVQQERAWTQLDAGMWKNEMTRDEIAPAVSVAVCCFLGAEAENAQMDAARRLGNGKMYGDEKLEFRLEQHSASSEGQELPESTVNTCLRSKNSKTRVLRETRVIRVEERSSPILRLRSVWLARTPANVGCKLGDSLLLNKSCSNIYSLGSSQNSLSTGFPTREASADRHSREASTKSRSREKSSGKSGPQRTVASLLSVSDASAIDEAKMHVGEHERVEHHACRFIPVLSSTAVSSSGKEGEQMTGVSSNLARTSIDNMFVAKCREASASRMHRIEDVLILGDRVANNSEKGISKSFERRVLCKNSGRDRPSVKKRLANHFNGF
ncbi:hypothetical protein B0H12DRAFT_1067215 [Mycena haematopus]|nr:hypothetical protein B0H12DRAFT_1067215 [Mycena haematopus]